MKFNRIADVLESRNSRSPHGERGLKFFGAYRDEYYCRRSPHGERGLKYIFADFYSSEIKSLPARGAWIEIWKGCKEIWANVVAPRTGSVD